MALTLDARNRVAPWLFGSNDVKGGFEGERPQEKSDGGREAKADQRPAGEDEDSWHGGHFYNSNERPIAAGFGLITGEHTLCASPWEFKRLKSFISTFGFKFLRAPEARWRFALWDFVSAGAMSIDQVDIASAFFGIPKNKFGGRYAFCGSENVFQGWAQHSLDAFLRKKLALPIPICTLLIYEAYHISHTNFGCRFALLLPDD